MLRACSRVVAAIAMAAVLLTAQAAVEPQTLTLACQGTTTRTIGSGSEEEPKPISMGIIVNFTKRTVHGFLDPVEQLVNITGITKTSVDFGGDQESPGAVTTHIVGSIDRVTGDMWAYFRLSFKDTGKFVRSMIYTLKCRPTQRAWRRFLESVAPVRE